MSLIWNVLKLLAKSALIQLGLMVTASATDEAIHKKMFAYEFKTLIISNEEMNDIKVVKSLEEYELLIKDLSKTNKNEAKEQKRRFLGKLLGTFGASLLGNLLTGKDAIRVGKNF